MKLLLIVAFIYVYFEYVGSEQNQEEMNLEEQIQNLQMEMNGIRQYLKKVCFELNSIRIKYSFNYINFVFCPEQVYLKSLPENGKSIKEIYLSYKAKDTLSVKRDTSLFASSLVKHFKERMSTGYIMGLSSQVVEDYVDIFNIFHDTATTQITHFVMMISSECKFFV